MEPIETVIAQGESETLEFKPSFNQDVIETAAAFANTRGGSTTCQMTPAEIAEVHLQCTGQSPDALLIEGKTVDDLDIDQVEESLDFIKKHINVQSVITGKSRRDDVWDYPLEALREALTNAVCHRDYGDLGDIQIKVYDQSLQIWSSGFLPFEMTVEELLRPNHSSKPRNRLIAQAFYDMGMIEQYGSGIERVINACVDAGLPKPEFENFSGGFQTVFYPSHVALGKPPREAPVDEKITLHDEVHDEAHDEAHDVLNSIETIILQACAKKPLSTPQLLELLGYKTRTGNFKRAIERLISSLYLLEQTLPDKSRSKNQKYRLTEKGKQFFKRMPRVPR